MNPKGEIRRSPATDCPATSLSATMPRMRAPSAFLALFAASALALIAQQPPSSIDPPPGSRVVLKAGGKGVQIYTCTEASGAFSWVLKAPDAKLFDDAGKAIGTHFAGPTWKLEDGSQVLGQKIASKDAPKAGSVPWLLLRAKEGTATGKLADVAFIQRTDTHGGVAPATGCQARNTGKPKRVHYTATYTFYDNK